MYQLRQLSANLVGGRARMAVGQQLDALCFGQDGGNHRQELGRAARQLPPYERRELFRSSHRSAGLGDEFVHAAVPAVIEQSGEAAVRALTERKPIGIAQT